MDLAGTFARAAFTYWLTVFPRVCRELARRRRRAAAIPDPVLRELALDAFAKRGNIEGAAAFAVLAPRAHRTVAVRAIVALQSIYNYADLLSEQGAADPVANARRLHEPLLAALDLDRDTSDPNWYEHHPRRDDGGYLAEMIATCRTALAVLPSYSTVATPARAAAERIVAFQSLSAGERSQPRVLTAGAGVDGDAPADIHGGAQNSNGALERWARRETPADCGLSWWETAAAGGSSLGLHALVALAAEAALEPGEAAAVEDAYFPWIGGLHSLLDSVVDEVEDADTGQLSLLGCYASRADARTRMGSVAARAIRAARALPHGRRHTVVLAGMVGFYASAARGEPVLEDVIEVLGPLARPTLLVFDVRRRLARAAPPARVRSRVLPCRGWREEEGADARAA
ncbi:MAG TPA: DUF2600 family protein [Solirubrobacteraceae bacterium]